MLQMNCGTVRVITWNKRFFVYLNINFYTYKLKSLQNRLLVPTSRRQTIRLVDGTFE